MCQKVDINFLPDDEKQQPKTGFKCVSPTEIRKCDNYVALGSEISSSKSSSKPISPILEARTAHSKALIETCEKIIAEERLASSQLKSSLNSTPPGTPLMQRISKIPKPIIASCCKATESLNEADLSSRSPQTEKPGAIARLHVVETQIKVTTTTPPASPKATTKPQSSPQPAKKTKNIFDFLKKNFGVGGGHSHKQQESQETLSAEFVDATATTTTAEKPILVLSEEELKALDAVKYDEIHKFDNSQFYIPTQAMDDDSLFSPPPLPKTPAPVNIEITRKIITDEILESVKTEKI
ncbi:Uncharacterized protein CG43427 [Eumeta japonica]|uniref:Uncharacterized protein CG43427 n=1 Tax=Eumeta variegata TaxID=151549 RepID=A0A4C1SUM1_EUMVA|nr:Uncharacterized protein CG43427 [Eumeta japonica]